jgi:ATP-dependent Lon protease
MSRRGSTRRGTQSRPDEGLDLVPAVLTDRIVFPGQRRSILVEWKETERAIKAAAGAERCFVLLAEIDGVGLEEISVGTLVEIEGELPRIRADAGTIRVFGREAVRVQLVARKPYLKVSAVPVETWRGEDAAWVGEVEKLAARALRHVKREEAEEARPFHEPPSFDGLSASQLAWQLAAQFIHQPSDRYFLLGADVKAQLLMIDADLCRRIRARERGPRRMRAVAKKIAARKAVTPETELPEEVQAAIAEERDRGTGSRTDDTGDEAVHFVLGMNWRQAVPVPMDLLAAKARLDAECYGLEAVKESVLDLLASWEWGRRNASNGSHFVGKTLCLAGPPGVGKTAIAGVIAEVMGRQLLRVPMGGVDDIFLVGADQSYRRARPGEIVRRIRQSQRHPSELVFLLDEIDKVPQRTGWSAVPVLLALLDPEQQTHWHDHFLDAMRFDLSRTVFICTANDLNEIAPPLLDRLQPLVLPAYSQEEQVMIGKKHLLPRLRLRLAVGDEVELADDVIETLVEQSDASPGMRQLQGQLETVLTRGLRRYLETEVGVRVTSDEALQWSGRKTVQRRIGFQMQKRREEPTKDAAGAVEIPGYLLNGVGAGARRT